MPHTYLCHPLDFSMSYLLLSKAKHNSLVGLLVSWTVLLRSFTVLQAFLRSPGQHVVNDCDICVSIYRVVISYILYNSLFSLDCFTGAE